MAVVYLAEDVELDRPVALKVLADNLAADEAFRRRFVREARLAARLSHPNVVAVYDAGEEDGRPYIVMEYVEGETLADVIRDKKQLSVDTIVQIGIQLAKALDYAHTKGIVHRDVNPGNIMLLRDGVTIKAASQPASAARFVRGPDSSPNSEGSAAYSTFVARCTRPSRCAGSTRLCTIRGSFRETSSTRRS